MSKKEAGLDCEVSAYKFSSGTFHDNRNDRASGFHVNLELKFPHKRGVHFMGHRQTE